MSQYSHDHNHFSSSSPPRSPSRGTTTIKATSSSSSSSLSASSSLKYHIIHDDDEDCCGCAHDHSSSSSSSSSSAAAIGGYQDHSHDHHSSSSSNSNGNMRDDHSHANVHHVGGRGLSDEMHDDECAFCDHDNLLQPSPAAAVADNVKSNFNGGGGGGFNHDHSHAVSSSNPSNNQQQQQQKQQQQQQIQGNSVGNSVIAKSGAGIGSIELSLVNNVLHSICDHCDAERGQIKHSNPVYSRLRIANLCCSGEERIIHNCLDSHKGVESVAINVLGRYILVKHCPGQCCAPVDTIVDILNNHRLGASIQEASEGDEEEEDSFPKYLRENIWKWVHVTVLILLLIAGSISQDVVSHENNTNFIVSTSLYIVGAALGLIPVLQGAYVAVFNRRTIDIHVLVLISIVGAILSHEYFDACLVVTLFIIAEIVEEVALQKVRSAVKLGIGLGRLSKNVILPDGTKKPLDKVVLDDVICCRAGDSVPVDGVVTKGECVVSESALTGEAMPIAKAVGASMKSGTIVQNGYVEIKVTVPVSEGTYQRLQRTVDMLQTDRGNLARFIDRFAIYWTPIVILSCILLVVIGGGISKKWYLYIHKALILLVLACPCAILLAAPLPGVCAIATATKFGVLIKGSSVIERIDSINSVAVDKTGTMTKGLFKVTHKLALSSDLDYKPLELAAAIESKSSHPLANAIVSDCVGCVAETDILLPNAKKIKVIEGVGMGGWVEASKNEWLYVRIGNERMLKANGGDLVVAPNTLANIKQFTDKHGKGSVIVMIAVEDNIDFILALADEIREEAKVFVSQVINGLGMDVNMLTGDHEEVALSVGRTIGIADEFIRSRLLPNEKLQFIENMQSGSLLTNKSIVDNEKKCKNVLMVGDGINDAAALSKAQVGVAMGEGGSAMAVDCADVIIMSDNLLRIPATIMLAKACHNIVLQNIVFAVGIKILAVIFATTGQLPFWAAVITDIGALLVILINSSRLICSDAYNRSSLVSVYGTANAYGAANTADDDTAAPTQIVIEEGGSPLIK